MSNENTAPTVPTVVLTEVVHNGKTYPVQTDPVSNDKFITVEDEKLGEVKLAINIFTEGEKAGLLYFVPEYADFEQVNKVLELDVVVDCVNAFIRAKIASKATAGYNAKTKAEPLVRDTFLQQLAARNNVIITTEEALAYRPFERGESMSGLLKQQKEISKKMQEAVTKGDYAKVTELNVSMLALMQRIQAFVTRQTAEFASLGEVAAAKAGTAD